MRGSIWRGVYLSQCKGVWLAIQVGTTLFCIGRSEKVNRRLEIVTPYRWLRWSVVRGEQ